MSLKIRILDDVKTAMKARAAERLSTLRMLTAAMKQKEVDERVELDDGAVLAIVEKLIKQRREAAAQFEAGGRADLAAAERAEIEVLSAYLPAPLSAAEIAAAIDAALAQTGAQTAKDMGRVMALLKPGLAGRADLAQVSAQVKARLVG